MGPGPRTAAQFLKRLQQKFRGRRFAPLDPPDFLDYEGAQLVFIGAAENAKKELSIEFRPDNETWHTADVSKDLKLPREIAREVLFKGVWQ